MGPEAPLSNALAVVSLSSLLEAMVVSMSSLRMSMEVPAPSFLAGAGENLPRVLWLVMVVFASSSLLGNGDASVTIFSGWKKSLLALLNLLVARSVFLPRPCILISDVLKLVKVKFALA